MLSFKKIKFVLARHLIIQFTGFRFWKEPLNVNQFSNYEKNFTFKIWCYWTVLAKIYYLKTLEVTEVHSALQKTSLVMGHSWYQMLSMTKPNTSKLIFEIYISNCIWSESSAIMKNRNLYELFWITFASWVIKLKT